MALYFATEIAGLALTPIVKAAATLGAGARLRRWRGTFTLASQLTTDTPIFNQVQTGNAFAFGILVSSVSLGTSTLAIGGGQFINGAIVNGVAAKYRAAATFTVVDTPTLYALTVQETNQTVYAQDEFFYGTIAVATLPASGTFCNDVFCSGG